MNCQICSLHGLAIARYNATGKPMLIAIYQDLFMSWSCFKDIRMRKRKIRMMMTMITMSITLKGVMLVKMIIMRVMMSN